MDPTNIHTNDLLEQAWINNSRRSFFAFRQYIGYPTFKYNWFVESLCKDLENFYRDFISGKRPVLIISTPPQHGKSLAIVDFIAWILGRCSQRNSGIGHELKVILTSFSDSLSTKANRFLQKILITSKYQAIFPKVKLPSFSDRTHIRTTNLIEFIDGSSFRNTTTGGQITGQSLDLGIIDDPIKSRSKANNKTHRDFIWDHLTDDFFTRFSEYAGLLVTLTPWHIDDPSQRMIKYMPDTKWVKYKAFAEKDEKYRNSGEPLFPEHKSKIFLLRRKGPMQPEHWSSMYQQNPVIKDGNLFKLTDFKWWVNLPQLKYTFIVADTAQKKGDKNDFTDFQLWGYGVDECIYLLDHIHERMTGPELLRKSKQFWNKHNHKRVNISDPILRKFWVEDKASGIWLIQQWKEEKLKVGLIPRSVNKEERANDITSIIASGRIFLNKNIKDIDIITEELVQFPNGSFDDAIDNLMNAIEVTYVNAIDDSIDWSALLDD